MISKISSFVQRIRWKAIHYENPKASDPKETFGFKTENNAPQHELLTPFEEDLYELINNIKFTKMKPSYFQHQLNKDVKMINESTSIFVPADKTTNLYKLPREKYKKLLKR